MSVDRTYIARNDAERGRLRSLVGRLSDADLARAMPAGWTVAGILAHLAFWDQRILALLAQLEQAPSRLLRNNLDESDVDWINDASKPFLLALAPRRAAELALSIADTVDGKVAALPDDLAARYAAAGSPLSLLRAEHRAEHLKEIEHLFR
jgi:Mycothiol maleylpyruvate isomerase N-terminal domain